MKLEMYNFIPWLIAFLIYKLSIIWLSTTTVIKSEQEILSYISYHLARLLEDFNIGSENFGEGISIKGLKFIFVIVNASSGGWVLYSLQDKKNHQHTQVEDEY